MNSTFLANEIIEKIVLASSWMKNKTRDVILFLGAGMGLEAKPPLPLGKDITAQLAQAMNMEDPEIIAQRYPLDEVAEWYENSTSWTELCDFIKQQIRDDDRESGDAYKIAAKLPFSFYVTTNYDTVLERAIGPSVQVVLKPFNDRLIENRKIVYKPHGTIDYTEKTTFILTTEQYEKYLYVVASPFDTKLKNWLQNSHVIFVGFNLRTIEFLRIHGLARSEMAQYDGDMPRHLAVFPDTGHQERNFWHRRGISIIDLEAKEFFRLLDNYLTPTKSETELMEEYKKLTGFYPRKEAIELETNRAGGDKLAGLFYLITREKIKRRVI
jgi:hypothetical protein